ncbi:hypothetical protein EGW08_010782, partial [Elysia chlorotica]
RQLYFTNEGSTKPGLDGATYDWRRVERISLDKTWRMTVITDINEPRGLALDLTESMLFYLDKEKVKKSLLDGSDLKVILDGKLRDPNGLSFDEGHLYVTDSAEKNKSSSAQLLRLNVATGDRGDDWVPHKLSNNVSTPKGLAVHGDTLYYSDWSAEDPSTGSIKSFSIRFGVDNNVILSGMRPTGLHYSPLARRKQDSMEEWCAANTKCSNGCTKKIGTAPTCICPDQTA